MIGLQKRARKLLFKKFGIQLKFDDEDLLGDGTITDLQDKIIRTNNSYLAEQFIYAFCPIVRNLSTGNIYFFNYDAKFAEELKTWDMNPLAILYESHVGIDDINYYGANVHFIYGNIRRKAILYGDKLSKKEQMQCFKDYIDGRAVNIFHIPEKYIDIAVLTNGRIINN